MEGSLWRELLGRSLGSHDAVELVGGTCHENAILCTKTDGTPSPTIEYTTTLWQDPFVIVMFNLLQKIHGPSQKETPDSGLNYEGRSTLRQ